MSFSSRSAAFMMAVSGLAVGGSVAAQPEATLSVTKKPQCTVPFPKNAMQQAPAGFKGETVALLSFTVRGEFRSARLLRSSGNRDLDSAALRAAAGASCKPLGDVNDENLQKALIGIPYAFTFDNSRGSGPAQTSPVR